MADVAHPPGTIVLTLGEVIRFPEFMRSLMRLESPDGSTFLGKQSVALVPNLNECIRAMVGEWIWIVSDDAVFAPTTLHSLLEVDAEVVVPLCYMRSPPFRPVVYKDYVEGGGWMPYSWAELPASGTMEVFAAGTMGMLVRRSALERLGDPWFVYEDGEAFHEDLTFCRRLRETGASITLTTDVLVGHASSIVVWPQFEEAEGRWDVALALGAPSGGRANVVVVRTEERDADA